MTIIGLDLQLTMVNFQLLPTIIDDNWPGFTIYYVEFLIVDKNWPGFTINYVVLFILQSTMNRRTWHRSVFSVSFYKVDQF